MSPRKEDTMKANKILLIAQVVGMYICHAPLYVLAVLALTNSSVLDNVPHLSEILVNIFVAVTIALIPLGIALAVCSIISIFKGKESPSEVTMVSKLVLIPWFILNFIFCACLLMGFLNPFFMIAIPFAFAIMVTTTYCYMIATSLPDITWFIRLLIKRKVKISALLIFSIVFLFFFCLDIVGGILFHVATKEVKTIE